MDKRISIKNYKTYQLLSLGIEITHRIMCLKDCSPDLLNSSTHLSNVYDLSVKWNDLFCDSFISKKSIEVISHE
jgi:hypothetical protein